VDHEEAGVGVKRAQALTAALVVALLVGGAVYVDREIGTRALGDAAARTASGEWFCPHGGGSVDWEVELEVANPGTQPATIRVRPMDEGRPAPAETLMVEPGSLLRVPVSAESRERATAVEWFDQWVAVGWVAHAGGNEGGVAAEPCSPAAGERWFLPDGTSETKENKDHVVVMNPFARDAVFSVALLSDRKIPVRLGELTDVVLRPYRSVVVGLNEVVLGERTVSALIEVSVGRVVAGSLGVSTAGGIRSAIGYLGQPPPTLVFPGGADAGRAELVVMSSGLERVGLVGELLEKEVEQPFAGLADSAPPAESGRTYPTTTAGPTSVLFTAEGSGVAASSRTFGVVSDQASTNGGEPAAAWLVLPAVSGSPSNPGLVLANPGAEPVQVTLSYLAPATASPVTLTIPPMRTATAPKAFVQAAPSGAVLAVASSGTFVPAAASYSRGREGFATYAVALGVPIPERWIPA
jgi:hypothetical protein